MLHFLGNTKNDDVCLQTFKMLAAFPESSPVGFSFNEAEINCGIAPKAFCW